MRPLNRRYFVKVNFPVFSADSLINSSSRLISSSNCDFLSLFANAVALMLLGKQVLPMHFSELYHSSSV